MVNYLVQICPSNFIERSSKFGTKETPRGEMLVNLNDSFFPALNASMSINNSSYGNTWSPTKFNATAPSDRHNYWDLDQVPLGRWQPQLQSGVASNVSFALQVISKARTRRRQS